MAGLSHEFIADVLSGRDRSLRARALRLGTSIVEPFYATTMLARNDGYARGWFRSQSLPRPTISVGNITTGGTGKTPVVQWLAELLRSRGTRPAVLLRGYRSSTAGLSDEQQLLDRRLNTGGSLKVPVEANPNRAAGAAAALSRQREVDVFILDDAFQHRRVRRDFELVLISAMAPFGYGHVLPRGLLREPLSGLSRAAAFLITRCSLVDHNQLHAIEAELRHRNHVAPIYRADLVHTALWCPRDDTRLPIDALSAKPFLAFCGIGDPAAFDRQLRAFGEMYKGHVWFPDHHLYTEVDVRRVISEALLAGAERIVTTEKDWVKIAKMAATRGDGPHVCVLTLGIRFRDGDGERLLAQVSQAIEPRHNQSPIPTSP
jgi:tetraacyldisaccharide 4'-kinase